MKLNINIVLILILLGLISCNPQWEEHYNIASETVEMNIWDALKSTDEASSFVQELENLNYDSIFSTANSFTLFIPSNDAMEAFKNENEVSHLLINYLITPHFIQSESINGKRRIQTLGQKFILFENNSGNLYVDGVDILSESPLYKNGKFFILNEVVEPKPNLYEYFAIENPILKDYIDAQDSLILDKQNSEPIGRNDNGEIIYDTVAYTFNGFEDIYFPVKQELRYESATIVFPKSDDYNEALTAMVQNMNAIGIEDYNDIPIDWQNRVLIPFLLQQGVFPNMLEQEEFLGATPGNQIGLKNILGNTIPISYTPVDKALCSNGYAYNYESFNIPDTLYMNPTIYEAEWLLKQIGVDKYTWNENVTVHSTMSFNPERAFSRDASNDSLVSVIFPQGYEGEFTVEFYLPPQFPRQYIMIVSTNMRFGGIYDIYVNDELMGSFDYKDFLDNGWAFNWSSVITKRYIANGNICQFDVLVDNITEYEDVKVKFVYTGPGASFDNGFFIDNILFQPHQ